MLSRPIHRIFLALVSIARHAKQLQVGGIACAAFCYWLNVVYRQLCGLQASSTPSVLSFEQSGDVVTIRTTTVGYFSGPSVDLGCPTNEVGPFRVGRFPFLNRRPRLVGVGFSPAMAGLFGLLWIVFAPLSVTLSLFLRIGRRPISIINACFFAVTFLPRGRTGVVMLLERASLGMVAPCKGFCAEFPAAFRAATNAGKSFGDMTIFAWFAGKVSLEAKPHCVLSGNQFQRSPLSSLTPQLGALS